MVERMTYWHYGLIIIGLTGWLSYAWFLLSQVRAQYVSQRTMSVLRISIALMTGPIVLLVIADWMTQSRTGLFVVFLLATIAWVFCSSVLLLVLVILPVRRKRGWLPSQADVNDGPAIDLLRLQIIPPGDQRDDDHTDCPDANARR